MTRRKLLVWSAFALVGAVALWIGAALIGLNFYPEGEPLPWFLRLMQWAGLALVFLSLAMAFVAMLFLLKRPAE